MAFTSRAGHGLDRILPDVGPSALFYYTTVVNVV